MKIFDHSKCEQEKSEILKTFESTIIKVLESMEKTQNKFVEMASRIEVEHFKQLEKQSARITGSLEKQTIKQFDAMGKQTEALVKILKPVGGLDNLPQENSIEKEDIPEPLTLEEMPPMNMQGVNLKFEGEEEILPINIS
jgi:hypothetical protein